MNMPVDWMQATDAVGAWLSTYLLHSTVLLVPALLLARFLGSRRLSLQESVLRVALIGGILTATLQCGLGWQAATGTIPYNGLSARAGTVLSTAPEPARPDQRRAERSSTRTAAVQSLERQITPAPQSSPAAAAPAKEIPWLALAVLVAEWWWFHRVRGLR